MTLGGEGKRDKQYQSQLNFGGSLPISMKIGKENIHWEFIYMLKVGSTYFVYKTPNGDCTKFKKIISPSNIDILEHFKNIDTSHGCKKCIYNWVGGPTMTINWLNSSITFYQ